MPDHDSPDHFLGIPLKPLTPDDYRPVDPVVVARFSDDAECARVVVRIDEGAAFRRGEDAHGFYVGMTPECARQLAALVHQEAVRAHVWGPGANRHDGKSLAMTNEFPVVDDPARWAASQSGQGDAIAVAFYDGWDVQRRGYYDRNVAVRLDTDYSSETATDGSRWYVDDPAGLRRTAERLLRAAGAAGAVTDDELQVSMDRQEAAKRVAVRDEVWGAAFPERGSEFDCPECHQGGYYVNSDRHHVGYCKPCGAAWHIGSNLLSTWKDENQAQQVQKWAAAGIDRMRWRGEQVPRPDQWLREIPDDLFAVSPPVQSPQRGHGLER